MQAGNPWRAAGPDRDGSWQAAAPDANNY